MDIKQAYKLYNAGNYLGVKQLLAGDLDSTTGDPEAHHLLGLTVLQLGEVRQSLQILQQVVVDNPLFYTAYLSLSQIYLGVDDYRSALKTVLEFHAHKYQLSLNGVLIDDVIQLSLLLLKITQDNPAELRMVISAVATSLHKLLTSQQFQRLLDGIVAEIARFELEPSHADGVVVVALMVGYTKDRPVAYLQTIFEHLVLPLMRHTLEKKQYRIAFELEKKTLNSYVKKIETEEHFYSVTARYIPLFQQAGKLYARSEYAITQQTSQPLYKVGFLLHRADFLAHVELMVNVLEGFKRLPYRAIEPVVIVISGKDPVLAARLEQADITLFYLDEYTETSSTQYDYDKIVMLQSLIAAEALIAITWVSVVAYMSFAFAMRIAPVQIWWAMKYHHYSQQNIDAYITGGSFTSNRILYGRQWKTAPIGLLDWYDPSLEEQANTVRQQWANFRLVIGTLGREEKLNSPAFIESVCHILKNNSDCVFLWTGKEKLHSIEQRFIEQGVTGQVCYIGWVNTRLYAQVIDIFIDSYPFPCGFTLFQAMAAGKATLFFKSNESMETGVNGLILPLLEPENQALPESKKINEIFAFASEQPAYVVASDDADYVALAQVLIRNDAFREQVAVANRRFINELLENSDVMVERYHQHFVSSIQAAIG